MCGFGGGFVWIRIHVRTCAEEEEGKQGDGMAAESPAQGAGCWLLLCGFHFFPSLFLFSRLCARGETIGGRVGIPSRWVKMSFTWLSLGGRRVGHSAFKLVLVAAGAAGALQ